MYDTMKFTANPCDRLEVERQMLVIHVQLPKLNDHTQVQPLESHQGVVHSIVYQKHGERGKNRFIPW